jgi:hypothetical protein
MRWERWSQTDLPQTDGNIHPSRTPCKLGLKGRAISGSDVERRCRLIPYTGIFIFSFFTDNEQIRVKKKKLTDNLSEGSG